MSNKNNDLRRYCKIASDIKLRKRFRTVSASCGKNISYMRSGTSIPKRPKALLITFPTSSLKITLND